MKIIRETDENEMILSFLKSEIVSRRFQEKLYSTLKLLHIDDSIILNGDCNDNLENTVRKIIMKKFRGYPGEDIFKNFPEIYKWAYVEFDENDLDKIYYVDYEYWNKLSNYTSKPIEAAKNIKKGIEFCNKSNKQYLDGVKYLENNKFPPIVLLTSNEEKYVVIEGHSRTTVYGLAPSKFNKTYGYIGYTTKQSMMKYDSRMV